MKIIILVFIATLSASLPLWAKPCPDIAKVYGPEWKQGFVSVPLDRTRPSGKKIRVAYYYRDQAQFANKTPMVFFNGGPTMAGHQAINIFSKLDKFKKENLIFIDQRGTGCSSQFPKFEESTLDDYKHFSSEAIVDDAEAVRKKLFNDQKWRVYGQSYGGLISFRYIERYPEAIASAHIHGYGIPRSGQHLFDSREQSILNVTDEILAYRNPRYSQYSIGELRERLLRNANFLSICFEVRNSLTSQFCGADIFTSLFMATGFRNQWGRVLKTLNAFDQYENNFELLKESIKKFVDIYLLRFNDLSQAAALNVISYQELSPGRFFYDGCSQENPIISECRFKRKFLARLDEHPSFSPSPLDVAKIRNNIKAKDIDIYYYGGKYDTFIPANLMHETASALDIKDRLVMFENSGHEGFYSEAQVIDDLVNINLGKRSCSEILKSIL